MLDYFKKKIEIGFRKLAQLKSNRALKRNEALWLALSDYISNSNSTGCGDIDYYQLYEQIRKYKPKEVLECGTGVTTLIIAQALKENEAITGIKGRLTSMEEHEEWLEMSKSLLPSQYESYVDFELSETIEKTFSLFRGVGYKNIPKRDYDFVFIDGPSYYSPRDGVPTFDFDFLSVLDISNKPVAALIDKRVSTCFVLQQLLGREKVTYSSVLGLGFILPSTKSDLGMLPESLSSSNFHGSYNIFGNSRLSLNPIH